MIVLLITPFLADGYTDWFYLNFTSTRKKSLILGTSKSAQGIQPNILDSIIDSYHDLQFQNFSFTVSHSPYGSVYLNAIKKKLVEDFDKKEGIFILSVDPWSISSVTNDPNDSINFRENDLSLGTTRVFNASPNLDYLLHSYTHPYIWILYNRIIGKKSPLFLTNNGWTKVTVPMDSISISTRINKRINEYETKNLPIYKFSSLRYKYLSETIEFLNRRGEVFLVRIPVHERMLEIETMLMDDFDEKMDNLSVQLGVSYFNYTNSWMEYDFTDGIHLFHESSVIFSKNLAHDINHLLNTTVD